MSSTILLFLFTFFFKILKTPPPQTAVILLQNHHEIRATGGFMGSYAKLNLNSNKKDVSDDYPLFNVSLQDIYVPDGQITGHVEPPVPIQQAFGQGWYRLRDSNWEPDFKTSSKTIRWFLEKGDEINPDVLVAVNLSTIEKILQVTGPIKVDGLTDALDTQNISLLLQNQIQKNFFPGSTTKKDILTSAKISFFERLSSLSFTQKLQVFSLISKDLKEGEIFIHAEDKKLQAFLEKRNWAGKLEPTPCKKRENCLQDTLAVIESNLGSNKANQFVTRQVTHRINPNRDRSSINHQIIINFQNSSPSKDPEPPQHHGGDYLNYLRIYLPQKAFDIKTSSNIKDFNSQSKFNFKEIGFFHLTKHQSSSSFSVSYHLPIKDEKIYQLSLLKQPGVDLTSQTIYFINKKHQLKTNKDTALFHHLP
jgi:hypothetical protein